MIKKIKSIPANCGEIALTEDGVLMFFLDKGLDKITVEDFKQHQPIFLSLIDKPVPFVSDIRDAPQMGSKEKSFVKNSLPKFASHQALVVDSPMLKYLVNTFLLLYQPDVETKLFTSLDEAYTWAKSKVV